MEATQEISIIDNSIDIFRSGTEILQNNKSRAEKAENVGKKIISDIQANGGKLTAELDDRCKTYLANCNKAASEMTEARKPITQVMDLIKKEFTESENKLDVKKAGTPAEAVQQYRNEYAKQVWEEQERKRKEAEANAAKQQEAIQLKAECEKRLFKYVNDHLTIEKAKMNEAFNGITLETFDGKKASLLALNPVYTYTHYQAFKHGLYSKMFTADDIERMTVTLIAGQFAELAENYKKEMCLLRDYLIERLPSKKNELEEIARQEAAAKLQREEQERIEREMKSANESERLRLEAEKREIDRKNEVLRKEQERLEQERQQREQEERQRLELEAKQQAEQHEQKADMNAQAEQTLNLFDKEAAMAVDTPAPESRQGYEIEILHPAAYVLIFQFWFENEGKNLAIPKMGTTKLDQMKAFCEKHAHKTGTKIENKFIKYNETFQAVNRKAK